MIRAVLDTNVVISAVLKRSGLEAQVMDLVIDGVLLPCVSLPVLDEYERVLARPFLEAHRLRGRQVLSLLASVSLFVRPRTAVAVSRDPDDNRFLECAEAAEAEFLVTGNRRHFPKVWLGTRVVNARELLHELKLL
jgi:uncharacterized protein